MSLVNWSQLRFPPQARGRGRVLCRRAASQARGEVVKVVEKRRPGEWGEVLAVSVIAIGAVVVVLLARVGMLAG